VKKVFSSIEIGETVLIQDALIHRGIEASIQNQHAAGSPIPAFRPPAEVWIHDAAAFDEARQIVRDTLANLDSEADRPPWACTRCGEPNPPTFDVCWSCEEARPR
jgi:hypothetical protein